MDESETGDKRQESSLAEPPVSGGAEAKGAPVKAPAAPRKLDGILIALIIVSCIASALLATTITLAATRNRGPNLPQGRQELMQRWNERRENAPGRERMEQFRQMTPEERKDRVKKWLEEEPGDTPQEQPPPTPAPDQSP